MERKTEVLSFIEVENYNFPEPQRSEYIMELDDMIKEIARENQLKEAESIKLARELSATFL